MLATLLLSFGVPMLLGGDEFGRTQQGNNNAYCQDNEITWLDWFTFAGTPMTGADWADPGALSVAIYLDGSDDPDLADDGSPMLDDDFLVLVNAWWEPLDFVIPVTRDGQTWRPEIDTYDPAATAAAQPRHAGDKVSIGPRSVTVLRGYAVAPTSGSSGTTN
jgi:isoamylase